MSSGDLPIRITVERPPAGVAIQVQRGRDGLLPPSRSSRQSISFDLVVRLGNPRTPGTLRFLGEFAQGPAASRFVYVNSGARAGQRDTCWDRRAKVALGGITPAQVLRVLADKRLVLEARIAGTARDGGPMCASVPLLGDGWAVTAAT
jgi:uncharacterized protein DUF5990